ncbi:MAG TPA: ATP-dependent zinc metalloprotease FtsH, partial [Chloroflexota bacterium]|nr:ATP-dependent zinc metalloprotease FtsH [Chloroflexota bacterium]
MRFSRFTGDRRRILLVGAIALLLVGMIAAAVVKSQDAASAAPQPPRQVHLQEMARLARNGDVQVIVLTGDLVTARLVDGQVVNSRKESQVSVLDTLRSYGVPESRIQEIDLDVRDEPSGNSTAGNWLLGVVTMLSVLLVVGLVYAGSRGGGTGRYGSFTRSGARLLNRSPKERTAVAPSVTFQQVAGVEEAKQELQEVVEFLKSPEKFTRLGATIPKGVLLIGPPGTGKTLLAKAVAGEAEVPFFSISGSEFVEMFVGVGAARVRDLFARARKAAPCIIFMDEIDAVGRHRGAGMRNGGGHDEREQTLNQILVEMDGFDGRAGVVIIAATNRPDVLDQALLRPGRFDRQVTVDTPDVKGRKAILAVHARGKPLHEDVDLETVARQTPGFSGADLANLMNEAAILAARRGSDTIGRTEMEEAADRAIAGPARKSRVISPRERRVTAYHELGHALVGVALPNCDPVHKVTIIGRGRAGGFTQFLPAEDRSLWTRSQIMDRLASMLGGHAAEELVYGEVTTGASNDIERATELAQRMVCQYGMSRLGPLALGGSNGGAGGPRGTAAEPRPWSHDMAREVDREVRRLLDDARMRARQVLVERRTQLDELT